MTQSTTPLTGRARAQLADEHLLRVESIIDLGSTFGSCEFESVDGALEDFMDDLFADERRSSDASTYPLFDVACAIEGNYKEYDELAQRLADKNLLGYVVQFATPVRKHATETGCDFSWGHCYLKWFYGETIDEVWAHAKGWADAQKAAAIKMYAKECGQDGN